MESRKWINDFSIPHNLPESSFHKIAMRVTCKRHHNRWVGGLGKHFNECRIALVCLTSSIMNMQSQYSACEEYYSISKTLQACALDVGSFLLICASLSCSLCIESIIIRLLLHRRMKTASGWHLKRYTNSQYSHGRNNDRISLRMQSTLILGVGANSTSGIIYKVGERFGCVMKSQANGMSYQGYQGKILLSQIAWQCRSIHTIALRRQLNILALQTAFLALWSTWYHIQPNTLPYCKGLTFQIMFCKDYFFLDIVWFDLLSGVRFFGCF